MELCQLQTNILPLVTDLLGAIQLGFEALRRCFYFLKSGLEGPLLRAQVRALLLKGNC